MTKDQIRFFLHARPKITVPGTVRHQSCRLPPLSHPRGSVRRTTSLIVTFASACASELASDVSTLACRIHDNPELWFSVKQQQSPSPRQLHPQSTLHRL